MTAHAQIAAAVLALARRRGCADSALVALAEESLRLGFDAAAVTLAAQWLALSTGREGELADLTCGWLAAQAAGDAAPVVDATSMGGDG